MADLVKGVSSKIQQVRRCALGLTASRPSPTRWFGIVLTGEAVVCFVLTPGFPGRGAPMQHCGFRFDTSYLRLPAIFYRKQAPTPVACPEVVLCNSALATALGLDFAHLDPNALARRFSGNDLPNGATPFSQAYAGHQFGQFANLGDGRAHVLGEHITATKQRVDIQLKGSGRTPYARRGDGRAALGPMLREYLMAEAMHALGIPTTRSLAVVTTGETVWRETAQPGAILTRVARSHLRIGTFEFAAAQNDRTHLTALLTYSQRRHAPTTQDAENPALAFLQNVMARQCDLLIHWMRVGFIHGVLNTDNVTISGETLDYGPCAFLDSYDPNTAFSAIDQSGRYAYGQQPAITQWNLACLAASLRPVLSNDHTQAIDMAKQTLEQFAELYRDKWLGMMRAKLGLFGQQAGDRSLISELLDWQQATQADYTKTFHDLSQAAPVNSARYADKRFQDWYQRWQRRLAQNGKPFTTAQRLMQATNPAVIPRNHHVAAVLKAAEAGDRKPLRAFLAALKDPYTDRPALRPYQAPPTPGERVYQTFCGT